MGVLSREIYKQIEYYFYNYAEIQKQLIDAKTTIYEALQQHHDGGGGCGAYKSDPTALKALKLTGSEIMSLEAVCKVVEKTIVRFKGTEKEKLLKMRYFQKLGKFVIMDDLNIEERTFYAWSEDIVIYAAFVAQKHNLIDVEKVI